MTLSRIAVAVGIALLTAFAIVVYVAGPYGLRSVMVVLVTMAVLIGAGNLLYGRRSHYAAAQERMRPAQEAHDRAADRAAEARRATTEAAAPGRALLPARPRPPRDRSSRPRARADAGSAGA